MAENMYQLIEHFQETVDVQCSTAVASIELLETVETAETGDVPEVDAATESSTDPPLGSPVVCNSWFGHGADNSCRAGACYVCRRPDPVCQPCHHGDAYHVSR